MGNKVGMGNQMRKIEIDERGRLTLPAKIRELLHIQTGDKLTIKVNSDNTIILQKRPSKEEVLKTLVGCIKAPLNEKLTPESIKEIWKNKQ